MWRFSRFDWRVLVPHNAIVVEVKNNLQGSFSVLTLSPNRTPGETRLQFISIKLYTPPGPRSLWTKKTSPKTIPMEVVELTLFPKKKIHRRRCAPITGEAEILGHFGPRQGASERDTKANPPVHCPLPTQYVDLMIFLFPATALDFFPSSHPSEAMFWFQENVFFQKKTCLFSMEV